MKVDERERKRKRMDDKYKEQTLFFLEGNFGADRLCEELPPNSQHFQIQIHSASLPRFLLKDTSNGNYASGDLHQFVKCKLADNREKLLLEDHPDLELTKFCPEVDWTASTWPISNTKLINDSLI